jgi:hypothetical protein
MHVKMFQAPTPTVLLIAKRTDDVEFTLKAIGYLVVNGVTVTKMFGHCC